MADSTNPDREDETFVDMNPFPDIGEESPTDDNQQASETDETEAPADTGELVRRLEALESTLQEKDRRIDSLMQAMLSNPSQSTAQPYTAPRQAAQDDLGDMPDPVESPQKFKQWQADQIRQLRQQQVQPKSDPAVDTYERFLSREDNSDLKEHRRIVDAIANEKVQEMRQRGVDPARAVVMDPEGVLGSIAKEARGYIQTLRGSSAPKNNRTAGVSAGGSRSMTRASPNEGNVKSFEQQVKDIQARDGIL